MIDKSYIEQIATAQCADTDLFIVSVEVSSVNDISLSIDSDSHVTIEQCSALSKAVEEALDRETEDFSLTVSSAGVGEPLLLPRQFIKTVGQQVEVVLKSGIKIAGELLSYNAGEIEVGFQVKEATEGSKRKILVDKVEHYLLTEIKSVREELLIK
ncbi:MAG: ribosome assembly cofactor RimP [Mucinivorans sp.]